MLTNLRFVTPSYDQLLFVTAKQGQFPGQYAVTTLPGSSMTIYFQELHVQLRLIRQRIMEPEQGGEQSRLSQWEYQPNARRIRHLSRIDDLVTDSRCGDQISRFRGGFLYLMAQVADVDLQVVRILAAIIGVEHLLRQAVV
jgi:hypothetical protein